MPQIASGKVLREARERKGYDLATVARRLRIRPDILRAIEGSDFANMPPRGYARNMVNAYARFLGLNPTEIVNMYLDEAYAYQIEKARGAAPGSGFVMDGNYQRRPRLRGRTVRSGDNSDSEYGGSRGGGLDRKSPYGEVDDYPVSTRGGTRHLYDDRTQYAHDGYGARDRADLSGRLDRDFLSHHSGYLPDESRSDFGYGSRSGRRSSRAIEVGETPMQYSAPRIPAFVRSRPFIIAVAAIVVILLVVFIARALGGGESSGSDDVSQLPVSGINDTTGTSDEEASEEAQVEIAPTSARAVYSVSSGDECYVVFYTDGEQSSDALLEGPVQETVEVTGTWTITTWSPDTIKVTVDGAEVELTSNSEYGGMYAYTVDFPAILEEWNSTHGTRESQRQAAVASANNALAQSSAASADDEDEDDSDEGGATGDV